MNRAEQIKNKQIWRIYLGISPDSIIFEGSKSECNDYIKTYKLQKQIKSGKIRLGMLIWENL